MIGRMGLALLAASALLRQLASAAVIDVGPHRSLTLPTQAAAVARDGDTVAIDPGDYVDCAVWRQRVVVEGTGPGVMIHGRACQDKAIFVVRGDEVTIRNLALADARSSWHNGAGIRAEGRSLLVSQVRFLGNENGVLSANRLDQALRVEDSVFEDNGSCAGECAHALYAGRIASLSVARSRFSGTREGHHIKSRARETAIVGNSIADGPRGSSSYLIDLPNGGSALIEDNRLEKGPMSSNPRCAVSIGAEGVSNPTTTIAVRHNRFTNLGETRTTFVRNMSATEAQLEDNELHGDVEPLQGPGTVR